MSENIQDTPFGRYHILEIGHVLVAGQFWDKFLKEQVYDKFIKPDWVVLEGGAHVGYHTVYLSKKAKKVIAFEPQRYCYNYLIKNLELNDCKNVISYSQALYRRPCKLITARGLQEKIGYGGFQSASLWLQEDKDGDIDAVTIDSLNLEKLNLIKLDCEGMEIPILEGAYETIKRTKPLIAYEQYRHPHHGYGSIEDFSEFFRNINYNICCLDSNNYLATPKEL